MIEQKENLINPQLQLKAKSTRQIINTDMERLNDTLTNRIESVFIEHTTQ